VRGFKELVLLIGAGAVLIGVLLLEPPPLLYPLAIASGLGVLAMLTALNTTLLLVLLSREASATGWRQAALPLVVGLAVSFVEIGAIDVVRYLITRGTGFPLLGQ
jgi:hypothetical protein